MPTYIYLYIYMYISLLLYYYKYYTNTNTRASAIWNLPLVDPFFLQLISTAWEACFCKCTDVLLLVAQMTLSTSMWTRTCIAWHGTSTHQWTLTMCIIKTIHDKVSITRYFINLNMKRYVMSMKHNTSVTFQNPESILDFQMKCSKIKNSF